MSKNNICKKIKELRTEKGITQATLAKELFVKQQTVGKWEKGELEIKADVIIDLANYFGVSSDYLLGLSDYKTPETADIGAVTGLADETINYLKELKKWQDQEFKGTGLKSPFFYIKIIDKLLLGLINHNTFRKIIQIRHRLKLSLGSYKRIKTCQYDADERDTLELNILLYNNAIKKEMENILFDISEIVKTITGYDKVESDYNNISDIVYEMESKRREELITKQGDYMEDD